MVVVTPEQIFKERADGKGVVGNIQTNQLNHTTWYSAKTLSNYTNVLIWFNLYWIEEIADINNVGSIIYNHFSLEANGTLKSLQIQSNTPSDQNSFNTRLYGNLIGNIFTDYNLSRTVLIPTDSYGWLFQQELDAINSETYSGNTDDLNTNIETFTTLTFRPRSSIESYTKWKPPTDNTGSTGSTGPSPPITPPEQNSLCWTTSYVMNQRRQDGSRKRYVQPDISIASYTQVINAHDYDSSVQFYYKFSEVFNEIEVYDYLYYGRPSNPTKSGLDKLYVRIDVNGNCNAAKSSATIDPQNYNQISWGSQTFNIFDLSSNNEFNFENLYISTNFYGALFTEEYDYFQENDCYKTFKDLTYTDISNINNSQDFSQQQNNNTNPPPIDNQNDPDDPNNYPPVDTSDPDDPDNIPPVDNNDNDTNNNVPPNTSNDNNVIIIDSNGNVISETNTDSGTTIVELQDAGDSTTDSATTNQYLGFSIRGKGGPITIEQTNINLIGLAILLGLGAFVIYEATKKM